MRSMDTSSFAGPPFGITWILQHNGIDIQRIVFANDKQPVFYVDNPSRPGSYRVCLDLGPQPPPKRCLRISVEFCDPAEVISDTRRADRARHGDEAARPT
jgi:hypothetical protein